MTSSFQQWFTLPSINTGATPAETRSVYRQALKDGYSVVHEHFREGADATQLVAALSWFVDQMLGDIWSQKITHDQHLALVAVGGYGRRELMPGSDIDLMILLPEGTDDKAQESDLQDFLTFLWDIGMEVGHSVRTPVECAEQAEQDVTIITNLVESRFLRGDEQLFDTMREAITPERIWPCRAFFEAKLKEQKARHERFHDTGYKLEPNIKESPGGLRDIQMIGWVAKRYFGAEKLSELVTHNFLTDEEYQALIAGQSFLWRLRFALHFHTGRREDRLLFDYQRPLAADLGYRDSEHQQAVELFMGDYFRNVQELNRLNDVLLQAFKEAILHAEDPIEPIPINRRFQASKGFLEVTNDNVFQNYPFALLEVFLILEQHQELQGVRASTIRLIRSHLHLVDDTFRADVRARSLFMEIFRQPHGLTHVLRMMNSYGVLAAYIPAFANIVGQMQFDLFHVYTVDVHTLFLVRNLRRFTVPEYANEYPLCSKVIKTLPKPELLYLAGLFHDIAKGRGGDHSELGAVDAYDFCIHHDLSEYDANLVSWLVKNHLAMSTTAQRRDISDPAVIHEFASKMGGSVRLDYLYLLTVADIRATNPELWNSWKETLLKDLFTQTKQALRRGLSDPVGEAECVAVTRKDALTQLEAAGISPAQVAPLWDTLDNDYFLRHTPEEIAWHAQVITQENPGEETIVDLRTDLVRGGTQLFFYTPVKHQLFGMTTAMLDQLGLSVADARIITSSDNKALNTYVIMEGSGEEISGAYRAEEIRSTVEDGLKRDGTEAVQVTRRPPRQHQHFPIPTRIDFLLDDVCNRTVMEIITTDRPGLLSEIGEAFNAENITLENARIGTFGTRAEDVFYITNSAGVPLSNAQQHALEQRLVENLAESA